MNISTETRRQAIRSASDTVMAIYGSLELARTLGVLKQQFSIAKPDGFIDLVGDTILGLVALKNLPEALEEYIGCTRNDAQEIISVLKKYFAHLDVSILNKIIEIKANSNPVSLSEKNSDMPELSNQVTPLRTLESDMKKVHGYGAIAAANQAAAEQPLRTPPSPPADTSDTTEATPEAAIIEETEPPTYKSSQHDTLARKPLTGLPSYHERE